MNSLTQKELRVRRVRLLMADGLSERAACGVEGIGQSSLGRWVADLEREPGQRRGHGRPRRWVLGEDDRQRLRWLCARPASMALAAEYFFRWAESGTCPVPVDELSRRRCPVLASAPEWGPGTLAGRIAELFQSHRKRWDNRIPREIRMACTLTKLEAAELRGERARNDEAFKIQRTMTVRLTNEITGDIEEVMIAAGMMFCSDDMSLNEPIRHAQGLGRQLLATHCVGTRRWVGANFIGRRGDAYTAVDISDHFRAVITAVGLPFWWVLERGPWDCDFINGVAVPDEWSEESGYRCGGLGNLFKICRKHTPQGKTIEGAFNYLQSRMAGHSVSVGRRRGGHEAVSRMLERAKAGNEEALQFLWSADEAMECVWQRMLEMNTRPVRRRCFGDTHCVPDELWKESYQRRGLRAGDAWLLEPVKMHRVTRQQSVFVKLDGYGALPFQFRVVGNDLPWRMLDNGHRVGVAFHPDEKERGATIINLERRAAYLRGHGFRFGEVLGTAPWVKPAPMEDFTGSPQGYDHHAAARAAVRQVVRAGGLDEAGMVRITRAGDGLGNALVISNQGTGAETAQAAPERGQRVRATTAAPRSLAAIVAGGGGGGGEQEDEFSPAGAGVSAWDAVE